MIMTKNPPGKSYWVNNVATITIYCVILIKYFEKHKFIYYYNYLEITICSQSSHTFKFGEKSDMISISLKKKSFAMTKFD